MRQSEAIERLCKIIDSVREKAFSNTVEGDCICGENEHSDGVVNSAVIEWIESAVEARL